MTKIIFEQVVNMILATLLACATATTVLHSTIDTSTTNYFVEIKFNRLWLLFILMSIIFSILRYVYGKVFGQHDGYDTKAAEFSCQDEREQLISQHATKITYRFMTNILAASLAILLFSNLLANSIMMLRLIPIILIAVCFNLMLLIYLIAWIFYDHNI